MEWSVEMQIRRKHSSPSWEVCVQWQYTMKLSIDKWSITTINVNKKKTRPLSSRERPHWELFDVVTAGDFVTIEKLDDAKLCHL